MIKVWYRPLFDQHPEGRSHARAHTQGTVNRFTGLGADGPQSSPLSASSEITPQCSHHGKPVWGSEQSIETSSESLRRSTDRIDHRIAVSRGSRSRASCVGLDSTKLRRQPKSHCEVHNSQGFMMDTGAEGCDFPSPLKQAAVSMTAPKALKELRF
ncbi:hypothetical protein AXG93_669s1350 [Marchantia polymorpha subsp. ruderalis]|uniref:Uncharacterized protein n=1 Tax=Marchantia polymorpha subsp. ruderalis TaxID=1480154 RepID=A0A176WCL1_MARPO|nr:hypothetical protein AXG93_669s1350 [Marchantia polymorpha subsp. ruderalis]